MKKATLLVLALAAGACSVNEGTFTVNWTVSLDGATTTCSNVSASTVTIVATKMNGGRKYQADFPCTAMSGEFDVPPGTYAIAAEIYDSRNTLYYSIPADRTFTLKDGDTQPLGTFNFAFTLPSYRASFRVHMGSAEVTGGNCTSTNPNNGAGVALEEVRLAQGGSCIPATMTGVINENNQPVSRNTCDQIVCQPNSVVHTIEGLQPGNYQIQLLGYKGATSGAAHACYYSLAMPFSITNADVNLGEVFAPFDPLPADDVFCNATKPQGD